MKSTLPGCHSGRVCLSACRGREGDRRAQECLAGLDERPAAPSQGRAEECKGAAYAQSPILTGGLGVWLGAGGSVVEPRCSGSLMHIQRPGEAHEVLETMTSTLNLSLVKQDWAEKR